MSPPVPQQPVLWNEQNCSLALEVLSLWAAFDNGMKDRMPPTQRNSIQQAFFEMKPDKWPMRKDPVVKTHLSV